MNGTMVSLKKKLPGEEKFQDKAGKEVINRA